ncbi:MAG: PUA domain-containing protein [Candidatus Thorarchaeota archaeon]
MEIDLILGLRQVKSISDYQFGKDITDILFDDMDRITIQRSRNTNKIRYIYYKEELLLVLRPINGLFTLTFLSAKIIKEKTLIPRLRIVVLNDIAEFIRKGRNVFCQHVVDIDKTLRPLDEIIVVNQNDELLGIGKLKVPVPYVRSFSHGVAVNIRKGIYKSKI